MFFGYLGGLVVLVLWGFLPSDIQTTYNWPGVLIGVGLIAGVYARSRLCRWALVIVGTVAALGVLLIQTPTLEFVATMWSAIALGVTSLLVTPSMRRYTS